MPYLLTATRGMSNSAEPEALAKATFDVLTDGKGLNFRVAFAYASGSARSGSYAFAGVLTFVARRPSPFV